MSRPGRESTSSRTFGAGIAKVEQSRRWQSIWITAARMAAAVFTMAIPMVLARVLDQTTFGHYKQLFLIAGTASALLTLGIPGSLYYFVPRSPENSQRFQVQSATALFVLGLLSAATILAATPLIEGLFNANLGPYLPWIAVFTALSMPAELIPISPMVDRRTRLAAVLVTSLDLLRAALLICVGIVTRDLMAVVIASSVVIGLKVLSVIAYLGWRGKRYPTSDTPGLFKQQLAYSLPFAGTSVVGLLRNKLHAFFVAASFGAAEFAIYSVATLSIPLIGQFTQTVGEVVVLENAKNYAANRHNEMRRIWHRATYSLTLVLAPIFALAVVFSSEIMVVLFGSEYAAAGPIFRIFVLIIPLSILIASPMLRATADLKVMLAADVVSLGVAIVSLLVLIRPLGPAGAVSSLVLAKATFIGLASRRTARRLDLSLREFLPWRGVLAMFGLAFVAAALASVLTASLHPLPRLLAGAVATFAGYSLVALSSKLLPASERQLIVQMLQSVTGRRPSTRQEEGAAASTRGEGDAE